MPRTGQTCSRTREWVSLRLDGELSELESALLAAHLRRCAACASFAVEVEAVALQLRSATLDRLEQPVQLPTGRLASPLRAVHLGAAAALVAAAAGLGTLFGSIGPHIPSRTDSTTAPLVARAHVVALDVSLAFAVDERPRGLPQYPSRDYLPRKGLALGTPEV
jgi:predicted anti-sigma-YlaC factor YlaD